MDAIQKAEEAAHDPGFTMSAYRASVALRANPSPPYSGSLPKVTGTTVRYTQGDEMPDEYAIISSGPTESDDYGPDPLAKVPVRKGRIRKSSGV
jgi:hypothetical protein